MQNYLLYSPQPKYRDLLALLISQSWWRIFKPREALSFILCPKAKGSLLFPNCQPCVSSNVSFKAVLARKGMERKGLEMAGCGGERVKKDDRKKMMTGEIQRIVGGRDRQTEKKKWINSQCKPHWFFGYNLKVHETAMLLKLNGTESSQCLDRRPLSRGYFQESVPRIASLGTQSIPLWTFWKKAQRW